jgi:hypothetical protein
VARVVELTVTTDPLPAHVAAAEALKLDTNGAPTTETVVVLFAEIVDVQMSGEVPDAIEVTVIVEFPETVNPAAVNVPPPATLTVIEAVNPVCEGELVL